MATKSQHNLISFDRAIGKSRCWTLGWTAGTARPESERTRQNDKSKIPGAYGLLVGIGRR